MIDYSILVSSSNLPNSPSPFDQTVKWLADGPIGYLLDSEWNLADKSCFSLLSLSQSGKSRAELARLVSDRF